jgi:hypothetical protein
VNPIVVIDTNVPVVANRRSAASSACVETCVNEILAITRDETRRVALDLEGFIIREYIANLSFAGQPGVGDAFLKWLHANQAVVERCEKVPITRAGPGGDDFPDFPADEALARFDPSDRKFVAVARAHPAHPPILEATDAKWWGWREALARNGVTVQFLCEAEIRSAYETKFGKRSAGQRDG